jgi:CheY-like chemotaxis protein
MTIIRNTAIITIPADKLVLIVEDNVERIEWFEKTFRGTRYQICTSPLHALRFLDQWMPDVVFLDHDAVPIFVAISDPDHADKTFFRVAQRLARDGFGGLVVIHSGNPVGAKRMADTISERSDANVVIAPFGSFKIERTCVRD